MFVGIEHFCFHYLLSFFFVTRFRQYRSINGCIYFALRLAEKFLEEEISQNYAILLLNLVGKEDLDSTIRVAGSIAFKNFVKRNWNAHAVSVNFDIVTGYPRLLLCTKMCFNFDFHNMLKFFFRIRFVMFLSIL